MKSFIVLALCVAVAMANPVDKDAVVTVYENDNIGVGGYKYVVQSSNDIKAEEQGELKNVGTDSEALQVRGSYSYVGPDGVTYAITYVSDENGFRPQGAHIPVAP